MVLVRTHHFTSRRLTYLGLALTIGLGTGDLAIGKPVSEDSSIGSVGINALVLHDHPYDLLGRKIAIGQVEIGRPGQFGIDKAVSRNRMVEVTRVFFRDAPAKTNANVDGHAQNVASVMISNAKAFRGVAPEARLYSSAAGTPKRNGQQEECLAAQYIASQNGGDVRAINFSFGESLRQDPRPDAMLDGNALLTQCIDWSARSHNVLYVVAGNQGKGGISIPTDNYNGLNVAYTTRVQGLFAKVDFANLGDPTAPLASRTAGVESNIGNRRSITLLAPGNNVSLVNLDGRINTASGTSFAAPHVTATVALLQEYGDRQLRVSCRRNSSLLTLWINNQRKAPAPTLCKAPWGLDARRHEVMKAVLINSANKLKDAGDGLRLGMNRTILDKSNRDWLASDAYQNPAVPLSIQMGAGQLDALRAYQQFSPGQWSADAPVPPIGWDYRMLRNGGSNGTKQVDGAAGSVLPTHSLSAKPWVMAKQPEKKQPDLEATSFREYVFEKPLQQGSFLAATLAWDRRVELVDKNQNGVYDVGEDFRDRGLNTLVLYLMRAEDRDPAQSIWSSVSDVDSVQHIFHQIPATGRYKLRVEFRKQVNEPIQTYAIAWWTVPAR